MSDLGGSILKGVSTFGRTLAGGIQQRELEKRKQREREKREQEALDKEEAKRKRDFDTYVRTEEYKLKSGDQGAQSRLDFAREVNKIPDANDIKWLNERDLREQEENRLVSEALLFGKFGDFVDEQGTHMFDKFKPDEALLSTENLSNVSPLLGGGIEGDVNNTLGFIRARRADEEMLRKDIESYQKGRREAITDQAKKEHSPPPDKEPTYGGFTEKEIREDFSRFLLWTYKAQQAYDNGDQVVDFGMGPELLSEDEKRMRSELEAQVKKRERPKDMTLGEYAKKFLPGVDISPLLAKDKKGSKAGEGSDILDRERDSSTFSNEELYEEEMNLINEYNRLGSGQSEAEPEAEPEVEPQVSNPAGVAPKTVDEGSSKFSHLKPKRAKKIYRNYKQIYNTYGSIIDGASAETGIDPLLLSIIIQVESSGDPNNESKPNKDVGKAKGLMMLLDGTADDMRVTNPYDPEQNIMGGSRYLKQLIDEFGSIELGLAAYHGGMGNLRKAGGQIPEDFVKTKAYVEKILKKYRQAQREARRG
jgi:hypothetical protein